MTISDYLANKVLDKVLRAVDFTTAPVYVSLHPSNPGITGAVELTGYSRKQVSTAGWNPAASRTADNINAVQFASLPAQVIRYVGLWDAVSNGNFLVGGALVSPATVASGDTFQFNAGRLDITYA